MANVNNRKGRELQRKDFNGDRLLDDNESGLYLDMVFNNVNDKFQVIENSRGFTAENCWSAIGGFIGIFVGWSLMQVPHLLCEVYNFVKTKVDIILIKQ